MLSRLLLIAAASLPGRADAPKAPPAPDAYDVLVRYQINAYRNERVKQFLEMTRYFKDAGFVRDLGEEPPDDEAENSQYDRMRGAIPADKAALLLGERHVRVVRLLPKGESPPTDAAALVRVDLELASGLPPEAQRLLPAQVAAAIADLKFREAVGYDRRDGVRLLGALPAGQIDALLDDVRKRAGAPHTAPIQSTWPIRAVFIYPKMAVPSGQPAAPAVPNELEKVAPELRGLQGKTDAARLEVILAETPSDRSWFLHLKGAAPGLVVEGRLGPLVSVRAALNQAKLLAALADVAAVRLPRGAETRVETPTPVEGWDPLQASGVAKLQAMNHKGRGVRVAVIDGDFSGRALVAKQLPDDVRVIDLTRARNEDLLPDPEPGEGDGKTPGHGFLMALAVLRAAPEAELVLVRIDPTAPYMLQEVARAINGEPLASENLDNRRTNFEAVRFQLDQEAPALRDERRHVLSLFADVTQKAVLLKKKEKGVLTLDEEKQLSDIQEVENYEKKQADWDRRDREYEEATGRFFQLQKDLLGLKHIRVAASGLVWNEGHPVDASSALTRYFDDQPFESALWFQASGDARGQAWSGLFRDENADGVMEFASAEAAPNDALWARQLDFLSWAPDAPPPNPPPGSGEGRVGALDLPAGTRARISLQWREAHDPNAGRPGEDPYRKPVADLHILVLAQPDPAGAMRPADDLDVVVQSAGPPQRLEATPNSAVYEQTVLLQVAKPGRYAVRIEGTAPSSTRPRTDPTIPAARKMFELRPRLFVETLEGPGRVLLHDFTTEVGTIGAPADSRAVITVGAADSHGQPQPYSAGGPPHDVALLAKPDVLAYDQVGEGKNAAQGTGVAAAFAAGVAAASGKGVEPGRVVHAPK
jgi:hypothetical protein